MQYILLLLSKTLITLHSLISHKYSESRAVIRAYIYPTWLGRTQLSVGHRDEPASLNNTALRGNQDTIALTQGTQLMKVPLDGVFRFLSFYM